MVAFKIESTVLGLSNTGILLCASSGSHQHESFSQSSTSITKLPFMDAETIWTWVLFAFEVIGISGMWIVGKKVWWGWAIVLSHSIPWFIYSLIYDKPGFIAMSFMWWIVNATNMLKWRKEDQSKLDG